MDRRLLLRVVCGALTVAAASLAMETSAEAGLFRHRNKCCSQAASCCEQAAPCCDAAPSCCQVEVVAMAPCCDSAPACKPACETNCCRPKRKRCFRAFKLFRRNNNCCESCEPACGC